MSKRSLPILDQAPAAGPEPSEDDDFPILHEASLDWEALDCVLADLDDFTEITELQGREADGTVRTVEDLLVAREFFLSGALQGLQITYRFADQTYLDTILRSPDGARLLRMLSPR